MLTFSFGALVGVFISGVIVGVMLLLGVGILFGEI